MIWLYDSLYAYLTHFHSRSNISIVFKANGLKIGTDFQKQLLDIELCDLMLIGKEIQLGKY